MATHVQVHFATLPVQGQSQVMHATAWDWLMFEPNYRGSMHRYRQDAHPTSNTQLALVVTASLASALGLVSLVLATANWYFHRTSSLSAFAEKAPFVLGFVLLTLAVVLFISYVVSRRTRGHSVSGKTQELRPRHDQKSVAQF